MLKKFKEAILLKFQKKDRLVGRSYFRQGILIIS
jgi:hypothetical protein